MALGIGLGLDCAKIVHEYVTDPARRDFDWSDCLAVTAMTGNEYDSTEQAMNKIMLPWFREVGLRYVQIARAGQLKSSGYEILDDSTAPQRMIMRGNHWTLADELLRAGTVPQVAHKERKCSARAKGDVLDWFLADEIKAGRLAPDFRHIIGFSADEQYRMLRDQHYGTNSRRPDYPLITWDYDRSDCAALLDEDGITERLGFPYPRSCCRFCPFQLSKGSRAELVARWRAEPEAGAEALAIERHSVALNQRMVLGSSTSAYDLAREYDLTDALDLAAAAIEDTPRWTVYEVRRAFAAKQISRRPKRVDSTRKGTPWRSVRAVATGTLDDARTALREFGPVPAKGEGIDGRLGIERAWIRKFPAEKRYPMTEHFYVISKPGAINKQRKNFEVKWGEFTDPTLTAA
ncbi:hypothetical protein [Amycolatopsis anabasis]|uniref:hypothetical protein n=1 Tax=Amycolatopsis anabasis TaxID=1840409 RepID=UPI00131C22D7|nr:hypothetical protein [Amycolatopsis anabasis]